MNNLVNNLKNKICLLLLLTFIGIPAFADVFSNPTTVEKITAELPQFSNVKCKFKQEKTMPGSNTVLKSGGDFEFVKNQGAIFKTTYPIQSVSSYKTNENRQINDIIVAISNKDYVKLKSDFDLFLEKKNDNWTLALVPKKTSRPAKHLDNIIIQGCKNINVITVNTKKSGKTVMMFDC